MPKKGWNIVETSTPAQGPTRSTGHTGTPRPADGGSISCLPESGPAIQAGKSWPLHVCFARSHGPSPPSHVSANHVGVHQQDWASDGPWSGFRFPSCCRTPPALPGAWIVLWSVSRWRGVPGVAHSPVPPSHGTLKRHLHRLPHTTSIENHRQIIPRPCSLGPALIGYRRNRPEWIIPSGLKRALAARLEPLPVQGPCSS